MILSTLRLGVGLLALCLLARPMSASAAEAAVAGPKTEHRLELSLGNGEYEITIDSSGSPDLSDWVEDDLAPVVREWYPKIVQMLPSVDYQAPRKVKITVSDTIDGVAYASGGNVFCNGRWFRDNLDGEAKGAVVHELVHVVQQYRSFRTREGNRPPGWLVEGIPDYIRWFLYEPESKGALIGKSRADDARYNASYRTSANFINWVADRHGTNLVPKLNARLRNGEYEEGFWEEYTGTTLEDLASEWKQSLKEGTADSVTEDEESANRITDAQEADGWELLFDGETTDGWHTFKKDGVMPGWKVTDGELVCADPSQAGDLCTDKDYEWFELKLQYKISQGGNSGIMFHVTDEGRAAWATGPELQLEDNLEGHDSTRSGWLYALYRPKTDPDTGMPIDATLPAGQWNDVTLLVSPDGCVHKINGVKYVDYVLGSDEFEERVAASKFSRMPLFAKSSEGMIALQGDHGIVSFRNIYLRPLDSGASK